MNTTAAIKLQRGDTLIIVDLQNDFLPPDGALAVPRGREVIPVLNHYIELFSAHDLPVFATRDWHPENHCSFKTRRGPWPVHCVINSRGAAFTSDLKMTGGTIVISKPSGEDRETYSAFEGTTLIRHLREKNIRRVFVGGLATDYCVRHTCEDALRCGFKTFYLRDASRAVNVKPDDGAKAEAILSQLGAELIELKNIAP